jgi:hypothetical protein
MNFFEFDDHCQAGHSSVQKCGYLQSPVEAVEGAAQIEVLETFLTKQTIAQYS